MALLKFRQGLYANLPDLSAKTVGNVYITRDNQGMFVDVEVGENSTPTRVRISDFVKVETINDVVIPNTDVFYFETATNLLKKYDGAKYITLNSTADITTNIEKLTKRVDTLETSEVPTIKADITAVNNKVDELNATNIDLTNNIIVTTPVGNYKKGQTVNAADLQTILMDMLSTDSDVSVNQPSISITLNNSGTKEVGSTFTPTYSVSKNVGAYGVTASGSQATGVKFDTATVTEAGRPSGENSSKTADSGSFDSFIVTDTTSYKLNVSASHSAGTEGLPKTYLGKDQSKDAIQAGTKSNNSGAVTGYRAMFYGMLADTDALNSDKIRTLTNGGIPSGRTITFKAADLASVKKFVVAIPASSNLKITSAKITSSMGADALSNYVRQEKDIGVEGADGYKTTKPYKVWVYQPASIADVEVHEVKIG